MESVLCLLEMKLLPSNDNDVTILIDPVLARFRLRYNEGRRDIGSRQSQVLKG